MAYLKRAEEVSSDDDSYEMIDVTIVNNGVADISLEEEMEIVSPHSDDSYEMIEDSQQRTASTVDNILNEDVVTFEDDLPSTSSAMMTKKERRMLGPAPISKKTKRERLRWATLSEDKKATFSEEANRLRIPTVPAKLQEELPYNTSSRPTFSRREIEEMERKKERRISSKSIVRKLLRGELKTKKKYHYLSSSESEDSEDYKGAPSSSRPMDSDEAWAQSLSMISGSSMYDRLKGKRCGSNKEEKKKKKRQSDSESNESDDFEEPLSSRQMDSDEAWARSLAMISGGSMYDRVKGKRSGSNKEEKRRREAIEIIRRRKERKRIKAEQQMAEILERKKNELKKKATAMAQALFMQEQQRQQQQNLQHLQQPPGATDQQGLPQELMQQLLSKIPASTPKAQIQKLITQMKQGLQQQEAAAQAQVHPQPPARSSTPQQQQTAHPSSATAAHTSEAVPQHMLQQIEMAQQMRDWLQTGIVSPSLQLQHKQQQLKTATPYTAPVLQDVQQPQIEAQAMVRGEHALMQQQFAADAQGMHSQQEQLLTSRLTRTELQELVLQLLAMHPDNQSQVLQQQQVARDEEQITAAAPQNSSAALMLAAAASHQSMQQPQQRMQQERMQQYAMTRMQPTNGDTVAMAAAAAAVSALNADPVQPRTTAMSAAVEALVHVFEANRNANEAMGDQTATSHLENLELARHLLLQDAQQHQLEAVQAILREENARMQQLPPQERLQAQQHLNTCLQIADSMRRLENYKQRTELLITEAFDMTPEQQQEQMDQLQQELQQMKQSLMQLLMSMTPVGTDETHVQQLITQFGQELMHQQGATTPQEGLQALEQMQSGILANSQQTMESLKQLDGVKQLLKLLDEQKRAEQQQPGPSSSPK